jgi:hypothetical protein
MQDRVHERVDWPKLSFAFAFICLTMLVVLLMPRSEFVLVVAPSSDDPSQMMTLIGDAGGSFVAETRFPWLAVAYSEKDGFSGRLMERGAYAVLNNIFASGCLQLK